MKGDHKIAMIIMLEDLEKYISIEDIEDNKRLKTEDEAMGSDHTMHIELENLGIDLSSPIDEPGTETKEVDLYERFLRKCCKLTRTLNSN